MPLADVIERISDVVKEASYVLVPISPTSVVGGPSEETVRIDPPIVRRGRQLRMRVQGAQHHGLYAGNWCPFGLPGELPTEVTASI